MNINPTNGNIINSKDVYMHDDILHHLFFDRAARKITLTLCRGDDEENIYTIQFVNVLGYEMTTCDYGGKSPYVFDFQYLDAPQRSLLLKLYEKLENTNSGGSFCKLFMLKDHMETVVSATSGDTLTIVCESILFDRGSMLLIDAIISQESGSCFYLSCDYV